MPTTNLNRITVQNSLGLPVSSSYFGSDTLNGNRLGCLGLDDLRLGSHRLPGAPIGLHEGKHFC